MKKTFIAIAIISALLMSCKSVQPELEEDVIQVPEEKVTSVNTSASENGKIYSVCVFNAIKKVEIIDKDGNTLEEIAVKDISYSPDTTEIKLNRKIKSDEVYKISGTYNNPPDFVVNNYTWAPPLVLFRGKKAVQGKDYLWNRQNLKIHFNTELDMDEDSYQIVWFTTNGSDVLANKDEMYKKEYETYISRYFFENPRW